MQRFGMCSSLSCCQPKKDCYIHKMYMNLTVTTRQKLTVDTQKKMRKQSKHNAKDSHQIIRVERRRRRKE